RIIGHQVKALDIVVRVRRVSGRRDQPNDESKGGESNRSHNNTPAKVDDVMLSEALRITGVTPVRNHRNDRHEVLNFLGASDYKSVIFGLAASDFSLGPHPSDRRPRGGTDAPRAIMSAASHLV